MSHSRTIKIGVIGAGYLGEFHIQQLQTLGYVDVVGFIDSNQKRSDEIQNKMEELKIEKSDEKMTPARAQKETFKLVESVQLLKETMSGLVPSLNQAKEMMSMYKSIGL